MPSLAKIIGSPTVAPTKTDELKIKLNILSSFLADKKIPTVVEDAYEAVEEKVEDVKEGVKEGVEKVREKLEL